MVEITPITPHGRASLPTIACWLAKDAYDHWRSKSQFRRLVWQPLPDGLARENGFSTAGGRSQMAINYTILSLTKIKFCGDTPLAGMGSQEQELLGEFLTSMGMCVKQGDPTSKRRGIQVDWFLST